MMHPLWNRLNDFATYIWMRFDDKFERYHEHGMEGLEFKDWNDTFWRSDVIYKAHLKTIIPEDGKGLWLMHINIFPREGIELPILGFDIVAGPKKITGSFMDFSPLLGHPHPYNDYMENATQGLTWNKKRELPEWAREIFSGDMIAVGNINTEEELEQFINVTTHLLDYYLDNLEENAFETSRDTLPLLNRYCANQKKNPHLHRSILAMGINEEDKNRYVNNVLFEER